MVQLVVVGDRDPMVFTLYLESVQLTRKRCDVRFGSVNTRSKDVDLNAQILLGGNDIPRSELCDHCFYGLVFVPGVVFFQIRQWL